MWGGLGSAGGLFFLFMGAAAPAQDTAPIESILPTPAPEVKRSLSVDFVDPTTRSSFHLTPRVSTSFQQYAFTNYSVWAFEADGVFGVTEGFGLTFGLPFGFETPVELPKRFFLGNASLGIMGGFTSKIDSARQAASDPTIGLGGALEYYLPTAPALEPEANCTGRRPISVCDAVSAVRFIRVQNPGKYLGKTTAFRARGHMDFAYDGFSTDLELSATPAFPLEARTKPLLWLGLASRAALRLTSIVEPYVELAADIRLAGNAITAPALLTPGVRLYTEHWSPAVFASIMLDSAGFIFGVDIAGVVVPTREHTREKGRDFMDVPEAGSDDWP